MGLSTGCTLNFKRIEIGGVGGVEGEEVRYTVCIFCVSEGVEKRRVEGEYPVRSAVNVRANMFWLYFCRMS